MVAMLTGMISAVWFHVVDWLAGYWSCMGNDLRGLHILVLHALFLRRVLGVLRLW